MPSCGLSVFEELAGMWENEADAAKGPSSAAVRARLRQCVDQLRYLVSGLELVPRWLPISMAYKNGEKLLLRNKKEELYASGRWVDKLGGFWEWPYARTEPDEWMPVPVNGNEAYTHFFLPDDKNLRQLSIGEQAAILSDPEGLLMLMNYHDMSHNMLQSIDPDADGAWPPPRWSELRELGLAIVSRDPDIWHPETLRRFQYKSTGEGVPRAPTMYPIRTAPKNGMDMLLFGLCSPFAGSCEWYGFYIGGFHEDEGWVCLYHDDTGRALSIKPMLWAPLPYISEEQAGDL